MDPGLPWWVMPFCWLTPGTGSLPVLKDLLGKTEGGKTEASPMAQGRSFCFRVIVEAA